MHYGLSSGKVASEGLEFTHLLADIETLNKAAFQGTYEVSAVSFHAYAHLADKYLLLPHGSSMGDNYGPMVVVRQDGPSTLDGVTVAIPGELTSAFLYLRMYKPDVQYVVMPFDRILEAVRDGQAEAGLLIHEGQLTFQDEGLRSLVNFGEWWAGRTGGLPLPLGGNVIRRDLGPELVKKVSRILHDSIAYSLEHRDEALDYALQYGRGLDRARADEFVGMYVNQLTLDYGQRGRDALQRFLDEGFDKGLLPARVVAEYA
jgi:1,4-dihydroxy-6-naphthoate synthase